jgi:hypothetical protein
LTAMPAAGARQIEGAETILRERVASMSLQQKIRLLTGADFWSLHPEPAAEAGLDLVMPGPSGPWGDQLVAAVRDGRVPEAAVDDKVLRLLRLAARVGAWVRFLAADGTVRGHEDRTTGAFTWLNRFGPDLPMAEVAAVEVHTHLRAPRPGPGCWVPPGSDTST